MSTELQSTLSNIGALQLKLGTSQGQLESAQLINNDLQQKLIGASATIARLSNGTLKTATGGDSFCVASLIAHLIGRKNHFSSSPMPEILAL